MSDVDNYIEKFEPEVQERLTKIRQAVSDVLGDVKERVYYGIPTVSLNGKDVMHYAGYKNHVSLIVGYDLADFLKSQYPQYKYTRATIIFPHKDPLPEEMVRTVLEMVSPDDNSAM